MPIQDQAPSGPITSATILPQRNPKLIERVARWVFRSQPGMGPQPEQQQTTQSGVTAWAAQQVFDQFFRSQSSRLAIYKDVEEMDETSEEVSVALDTIADNVTSSEDGVQQSFQVVCEDAGVMEVLENCCQKADLYRKVYALVRNLVKYGDSFTEIVVQWGDNGQGEVVDLKQLPPVTMWRNQDAKGNLKMAKPQYDPKTGACLNKQFECAFEQRTEDTAQVIAAFYPWQILHLRLNHDGFAPYGRSAFRVTRMIWKKLHALEEGLIIGRLTRAYLKYLFKWDTTGMAPAQREAKLTELRQAVTQRQAIDGRRENPYWVLSDLHVATGYVRPPGASNPMPALTSVEALDPKNAGMTEIADIEYFHRKYLCTLRVPPAHLGFEQDVNAKATLGQQDVQFVRWLRRLQQLTGHGLEQVFDTALALAGYDPTEVEYEIQWPRLSAADEQAAADAEMSRATADNIYAQLDVIDSEWIQRSRFGMTDEDIAAIKDRLKEQATEEDAKSQDAAAQSPQVDSDDSSSKAPAGSDTDDGSDDEETDSDDDAEDLEQELHLDGEGHGLMQAWSAAARERAALVRRSRAHAGIVNHSRHTGTHSHSHAHGNVVHSHSHAHAGTAHHQHAHSSRHSATLVGETEAVTLLAQAIRARAEDYTRDDLARLFAEQRATLGKAQELADELIDSEVA